jgi:hypothetical protein
MNKTTKTILLAMFSFILLVSIADIVAMIIYHFTY